MTRLRRVVPYLYPVLAQFAAIVGGPLLRYVRQEPRWETESD